MKKYQPIGKQTNGWTNFDIDYFDSFLTAKKYIEKNCGKLIEKYGLSIIGLDVFDYKKQDYMNMFWEYKNNAWNRNYKD